MFTEFIMWLDQSHIRSRAHSLLLCLSFGITLVAGMWSTVSRQQVQRQQRRIETLQQVVGNLHSGMAVVDRNGIIQEWNAAATKMFGWTADEAIGSDVAILLPPADRDTFREEYNQLLALGVTSDIQHLDCWGMTKVGESKHVLVSVRVSQVGDDLFALVAIDNFHQPRLIPACNSNPDTRASEPTGNLIQADRN